MWKQIDSTRRSRSSSGSSSSSSWDAAAEGPIDIYRLGWVGDFVDVNFLELWTCDSGNNNTGFCDKEYDALVAKAKNRRTTPPSTPSTSSSRTS